VDKVGDVLWRLRIAFLFGCRPTSVALAPKHQSTRAANAPVQQPHRSTMVSRNDLIADVNATNSIAGADAFGHQQARKTAGPTSEFQQRQGRETSRPAAGQSQLTPFEQTRPQAQRCKGCFHPEAQDSHPGGSSTGWRKKEESCGRGA
jgi:hypothetical protein